MSRSINKVILIGNLGRDPEITYTPSGLAIARLSLATTERRRKGEGEWEDVTEWHRITAFGKQAESAGQYLLKGQQIYVEGRIHYGSYEKDGVKHYTTDIYVDNFIILGKRDDGGRSDDTSFEPRQPSSSAPIQPQSETEIEDDLPF